MSICDRLDQIACEAAEAHEQWDCGRSAFNADNHAPPIDDALANGDLMLAALRAVLDLHKPRNGHDDCGHCVDPADAHWGIPWPCPTVRAIESALGVAAA